MTANQPPPATGPDARGFGDQRFRDVLARGTWVALLAHLSFIAVFAALAVWPLALFNVGSVLLYVACLWLIRRRHFGPALVAAAAEVAGHAALALVFIGWASGFHYYLVVLVPLVYFHPYWPFSRKLGFVSLLVAIYLWLAFGLTAPPLHALPAEVLAPIRALNIAATFGFLAYFSHQYAAAASSAEAQLAYLAGTDPLTGLFNRRRLAEQAALEIARHRRAGRRMSLVICDIDNFKQVNDRHGHDCGDEVLKAVAALVRDSLRGEDVVARWGGEELLILLPETGREAAAAVAGKLRQAVEALRVTCNKREIAITLTAGVCELRPEDSLDAAVARADRALLAGKRAGKNRIMIADAQ